MLNRNFFTRIQAIFFFDFRSPILVSALFLGLSLSWIFDSGLFADPSRNPERIQDPQGKVFAWKLSKDQVIELNEFHSVQFRALGQETFRQDKNRIALKVADCSDQSCRINGNFDIYVRYGKTTGPFRKEQNFYSDFYIRPNGRYEVPDEYAVPNLRSIPSFPEERILPGSTWTLPAEESFDFKSGRIRIPVRADYKYTGVENWKWNQYSGRADRIEYSYPIFYQNSEPRDGLPVKIFGFARGTVFFDSVSGLPQFKENMLSYTFVNPGGFVTEINFHIFGIYQHRNSLSEIAKEEFREQIEGDLGLRKPGNPDGLGDQTFGTGKDPGDSSPLLVRRSEEGVSISMDSILFDLEKFQLKPEAMEQLEKIAQVLKKYPNREVRISGHTDSTGRKDFNQKLSEDRAKAVLDAFVEKFGLNSDRFSFQGFADSKPVAPNKTEEERRKNRRVDITIVLD